MGVAVVVLKAGKVLNTPLGQLVVAAAIADDVIALIILSELKVSKPRRRKTSILTLNAFHYITSISFYCFLKTRYMCTHI